MKEKPLPPSWSWVKLGEICKKVEKVRNPNEDEQFSYLDIGGINNHSNKVESFKQYKWKNAPSRAKQIVQSDDILFSTVRTYLKNIARVPKSSELQIASTGFCVIRPDLYRVVSDYVFYFTLSKDFLERLNTLQTGSSYPAVRDRDVFNQKIPLPPLQEQHRIVEKIEELFSELDNGIDNLKKAKAQIKTYRQAVLKTAFEGKLVQGKGQKVKGKSENGELPEGWEWVKLGALINFIGSGATPRGGRSVYKNGGIIFIRSQNVYPNELRLEDVAYISEEINHQLKRSIVKPYDVLLNITGASIGRATYIPKIFQPANVNQHVCIIRTSHEKVEPKYLSSFLNSPFAQDYIARIQIGATRQALNYSQIKNFPFPLAPIKQQAQIVEEIEKRFSVADKMEAAIDESLKKAEALRQSILKQAFEGKLV
ncbi:type i restriction-modification system, specificity subunit s [hydrocarbon metagenome]|uniref:Type i restriction-modification system, specificity subunit s n=1 Tax=hydrocarbon metagenome TaxID=938273 RepID=A0A0W8FYR7_9ZZZZ